VKWLRHAFATDPPGPATPTPPQAEVIDRVCQQVVRRRLTTPALLFIEMSRPLNYLGAQALQFFDPIVSVVVDTTGYRHFADFLEQRGSLEHLCRRIEFFEAQCSEREREACQTAHVEPPVPDHER
jgi:hypothetical protein